MREMRQKRADEVKKERMRQDTVQQKRESARLSEIRAGETKRASANCHVSTPV